MRRELFDAEPSQLTARQRESITMTNRQSETLDRDQQILNRLAQIEHKVDSLDQTTAFALRADSAKHQGTVEAIFKHSKRRAQVYLATDGTRGAQEIADYLHMQRQNVAKELHILREEGLLDIIASLGNKDIWSKKSVDRTIRITQLLCEKYNLRRNGTGNSGSKRRKRDGKRGPK